MLKLEEQEMVVQKLKGLKQVEGFDLSKEQGSFEVKRMGGLSNMIYEVSQGESRSILKCFSNYFVCLLDRARENRISLELGEKNIGPRVLFYDSGFRLESFLEKQPISVEDLKEDVLMKNLAEVMVKFHKAFEREQYLENNTLDLLQKEKVLEELKKVVQERVQDEQEKQFYTEIIQEISSDKFKQEIQKIWEQLEDWYVFAHNDLNSTNILVDEAQKQISLIDFEYSGFDKVSIEFANLFNEMTVNYEHPEDPFFQYQEKLEISENTMKNFFANYLQSYFPLEYGKPSTKANTAQNYSEILETVQDKNQFNLIINQLITDTKKARIFSDLKWMIVGILSLRFQGLKLNIKQYVSFRYNNIKKFLGKN